MASGGKEDICGSDRHVRFTKKKPKAMVQRPEKSYTPRDNKWRIDDASRRAVVYDQEPSYTHLSEQEQERMSKILAAASLEDEQGDPIEVKRRSKVWHCDFCHKSYIAVVRGSTNVEELPAGCPERLCGECGYLPTEAKGTLKQELPGWFIRCDEDRPKSYKSAASTVTTRCEGSKRRTRISGKDYRNILQPLHSDSLDPTTSLDEDEMFYAKRLSKIPRVYESIECLDKVRKNADLFLLPLVRGTDMSSAGSSALKLPAMRDCYVSSNRTPSKKAPICERHRRGDSRCWVGKDIQDIPESAYRRTAHMYEQYRKDVYRPGYTSNLNALEENRVLSTPQRLPLRRDLPPPPPPPSSPAKPSRNIFD